MYHLQLISSSTPVSCPVRSLSGVPRRTAPARAEAISWGGKDPLCAHVGYCFKGNFMFAINLSR